MVFMRVFLRMRWFVIYRFELSSNFRIFDFFYFELVIVFFTEVLGVMLMLMNSIWLKGFLKRRKSGVLYLGYRTINFLFYGFRVVFLKVFEEFFMNEVVGKSMRFIFIILERDFISISLVISVYKI